MKVLVLCEYPFVPGGLSTQAELLVRGLREIGVETAQRSTSTRTRRRSGTTAGSEPDVVVGVGYWGHTPHLVLHPQRHGMTAVPWLVADGYVANYRDVAQRAAADPGDLQLGEGGVRAGRDQPGATSRCCRWGATRTASPRGRADDAKVVAVRRSLGVAPDRSDDPDRRRRRGLEGGAGGHAGPGARSTRLPRVEVCLQGLAAAADG